MTIITSQEEFNKRLHKAKLEVIHGNTHSSFEEVLNIISSRSKNKKTVFVNEKELCIK